VRCRGCCVCVQQRVQVSPRRACAWCGACSGSVGKDARRYEEENGVVKVWCAASVQWHGARGEGRDGQVAEPRYSGRVEVKAVHVVASEAR